MIDIAFTGFDSEAFSLVRNIRTTVFTNEQGADANGEFDEFDKNAVFALLYENLKAAATARIVTLDNDCKIGRIAVLREYRGKGYGAMIVNAVTERAFSMGAERVFVDAQNYAVPFYEKLGFIVIGDEITDRGLPHIPMVKEKKDGE